MQANIFTLPVSLEQVAAVIKRMRPQDRQQLLAAEVLALATFGTTPSGDILGVHIVTTSDQPIRNCADNCS